MPQALSRRSIPLGLVLFLLLSACAGDDAQFGSRRSALTPTTTTADFARLPEALFASRPVAVVEAPWGPERGSFQRELQAAQTGPMAIAAEPGGGLAVVDTVGARLYRFDRDGGLRAAIDVAVETADDLVVLPDGRAVLLAYRRTPTPGYDLLTYDPAGALLSRRAAPQAANLPTALIADGDRLLVEQRHEWLHPAEGGEADDMQWGRPAGTLQARVRRLGEEGVLLWAVDSDGRRAWDLRLETPWPVTQILALEDAEPFMVLVLRHIDADATDAPAEQQTWLVAVSHSGEALGRLRLVDSRVTDAGQPFAVDRSGDFYELVTDDAGVAVLRYDHIGGGA